MQTDIAANAFSTLWLPIKGKFMFLINEFFLFKLLISTSKIIPSLFFLTILAWISELLLKPYL